MTTPTPAARRVEYTPLRDLAAANRNPKAHDLDGIRASVDRFGFTAPVLLDERTNRLVAGHGRVEALAAMRDAGDAPPDGVTAGAGDWLIPVTRGWASRSDAEAEAMLVADNRLTELGGWDDQALADLLSDLAPDLRELAGYTTDDLDSLLAELAAAEPEPELAGDPDDAPAVGDAKDARAAVGDVWILGKHRLLVGDSTDQAAVDRLMAGDRAHCMWTDPPYGIEYVGKTKDALTIVNDGAAGLPGLLAGAFAVATSALTEGAPFYIAHPAGELSLVFGQAVQNAGWSLRQQLVWVKSAFALGRSDYHYRHEPIWMGYTAGGEGRRGRGGTHWYGDNSQDSVFEIAKPKASTDHPTMKPVELIRAMLTNSCPPGGLVYEPFGGSGSTLVAAHSLGMRARVVELDPRYADVICRRYQEASGEVPVHEESGAEVSFLTEGKTA